MSQGKFCGFPSMRWWQMLLLFQSYHKLMKTSKTSTTCKVDWSCSQYVQCYQNPAFCKLGFTHMKCSWNPTTSHRADQRRSVVPTSQTWWQAVHSASLLQISSANVSKTSVSGFTTFLLISEKAYSLFAPLSPK